MTTAMMVAPYRQRHDGWGEAARTYALSMMEAGVKLTLRPWYYTQNTIPRGELHPMLEMAEHSRYDKYDAIIQMVLPQDMIYYSPNGEKNIAITFMESNGLLQSPINTWLDHFRLMDKVLVSSKLEADQFPKSIDTGVIKQAIDLDWCKAEYERLPNLSEDRFYFYFIGSQTERKNLPVLLAAFHMEFGLSENVGIVLKAGDQEYVHQVCQQVKQRLGIRKMYLQEVIVADDLSDEEIARVHTSCNTFVMPSSGECLCRPVLDALAFGNSAIVTDGTAMMEIPSPNLHLFDSHKEHITLNELSAPGIHTPYETWSIPSIIDLRSRMRIQFEEFKNGSGPLPEHNMEQFGMKQIGEIIKNEIDA